MSLLLFMPIFAEISHCLPTNDQLNEINKRRRRGISDSEWEDASRLIGGWSCQRCTLVNGTNDARCQMCQFENLTINENNRTVPSHNDQFDPGSEWACTICDQLNPSETSNCCWCDTDRFLTYEDRNTTPADDDHIGTIWMCSKCDQMNPGEMINCVWCEESFRGENSNAAENILNTQWKCCKKKCGVTLPYTPSDSRCPSCNKKSLAKLDHGNGSIQRIRKCFLVEEKDPMKHTDTYNDIMQHYRNAQQTFVDDSFPHSTNSLGDLALRTLFEEQNLVIEWLRPHQISTHDYYTISWSVFNDPQPTDISQGRIGDCWFISSLALVAERPDLLEKLFVTKEYNPAGVYELRLCIDGIWQHIFVDDFFPCRANGHTMLFATGRKNQLWVSLVEKALAKAYGSYSTLHAGYSIDGLSILTGWPVLSFRVDDYKRLDHGDPELDHFWAQLSSAREARDLIACSTGATRNSGLSEASEAVEYRRVGLIAGHGYSILDVRQLSNGQRLLQVRNPWGHEAWLGEFGQNWSGWTSRLRRELTNEASDLPGTFWIPFHRFIEYFGQVHFAEIREHQGWVTTRYKVKIGSQKGKTVAIRLVLTERTELCVTMFKRIDRHIERSTEVLVYNVMKLFLHKQKGKNKLGKLILRSSDTIYSSSFVRTDDIILGPGQYLLYAHSGELQKFSGTIVIYSSKSIHTELVFVSSDNLHASFEDFVHIHWS